MILRLKDARLTYFSNFSDYAYQNIFAYIYYNVRTWNFY